LSDGIILLYGRADKRKYRANDVLKFCGCAEADELEGESGDIEKSGDSIFLGFENEPETHDEQEEEPEAAESEPSIVTSKSAGPSVDTVESDLGPAIEHLWSFQCPMTKGYSVTSVDWNKSNCVYRAFVILAVVDCEIQFE